LLKSALLSAIVVAAAAAWFYAGGLDRVPVYLHHDEVNFARHAHSLASSGTDLLGNRYPTFFQEPGYTVGRDPMYVYATAAALKVLPWRESTLRVAPVAAALVAIALVVLIGAELFGSVAFGVAAGVLLALSPAYFLHARQALSVIFPVTFVAWWLLFLLRYLRTGGRGDLALATAGIGIGLYAYLGMAVLLPVYAAITVAAVISRKTYRDVLLVAAILALTALPLVAWQLTHPTRVSEIATGYRLFDPNLGPLRGSKELLSWFSISTRADVYWQAFNPGRLFFSGESPLTSSTRQAGTFPLAFLWLLPIGVAAMLRPPLSPRALVVIAGLLTAPLPSVIVNNANVYRYLGIMVFGAVVATAGLRHLWMMPAWWGRIATIVSVMASAWLFGSFHRFYYETWPVMVSPYHGNNLPGALKAALLKGDETTSLYLSSRITYIDYYVDLYLRLWQRDDVRTRLRALDIERDDWRRPDRRSIAIIANADDQSLDALTKAGWSVIEEIKGLDSSPDYLLLSSHP
jgi:4-amino-4-deoxy-L-arabinose transferase-like glycosyltransferase